ncbi:alpha/beta fold hydrolase [Tenggerimyces flavus]|uniref:Alpha/beta fold hydrolase n=1 Tax=Tenggerimyces flavus TaxID=1708749 RepID=A0ABV7YQC8_9ACTN|nr:alpha/beta hydrolase [Tenggerimyces flavus]MBM7786185.1 pimeloyl-ACP methyl ester carboxylesterase [Tenggerimyces flavus]
MNESSLALADGRTLHYYDLGGSGFPVFWHHGTTNIGTPPAPLYSLAARLGLRWVSIDRPGYGGSTRQVGRTIADTAADVLAVADALGFERFAVMGQSGGGMYTLGCAAALPSRVAAAVSLSGPAPFSAEGLDWYAGMIPSTRISMSAGAAGLEAREELEASSFEYDMELTEADIATLSGEWSWFGEVVRPAMEGDPGGGIDDDIASTHPWGCDPRDITAPLLLIHGDKDQVIPVSHGKWLAAHCPTAELRVKDGESHISIITHAAEGLEWLAEQVRLRA